MFPAAVFLAAAVAGLAGGCGQPAGCSLSGSDINCAGATFDACVAAGCPIGYFNCPNPPVGCRIAPGMVLARYAEKPPNTTYLCGDPLAPCGTWTEASCQVTVTTNPYDASTTYTLHDSTCP